MFQHLLQNTLETKWIIIYFKSEITFPAVNYTKLPAMNNNNLTLALALATDNGDGTRGPPVSTRRHASASLAMRRKGGITTFILASLLAISICLSITGVNGAELEQEGDNKFVSSIFHDHQVNISCFFI